MPDTPLVDAMPPLSDEDQRKLRLAISAPRALGPIAQSAQPPAPPDMLSGAPPVSALGLGAPSQPRDLSTAEYLRNQVAAEPKQSQFQPQRYSPLREAVGLGLSALSGVRSTPTGINIDPSIAGQTARAFEAAPAEAAKEKFSVAKQSWQDQLKGLQDVQQAENTESEIKARTVPKPTAEKNRTTANILADLTDKAISEGRDPNTDPQVQQVQAEMAKDPAAAKENKAVSGISKGKPAFAVQTPDGWIDPQTKQPIPDFSPQPSFAETGLWEPVMVPSPDGGMVPGRFNKRTGQTVADQSGGKGAPLPREASKAVDAALTQARESDTRQRVMHDNSQRALQGDQQAMLALVANHIGMTLGQQKGARINQTVWNEAVQSSPILARAQAKFDDRGYLSGVVLTPDQIKSMVDLADERRMRQWQQAADAAKQYGVEGTVQIPPDVQQALQPAAPKAGGITIRRDANGRIIGVE